MALTIGLIYGWAPGVCEPSEIVHTFVVHVDNFISEFEVSYIKISKGRYVGRVKKPRI